MTDDYVGSALELCWSRSSMMNDYVLSIQARTTLLREPPGRCNPAWGSPKILAADQLEQKGDAQGGMQLLQPSADTPSPPPLKTA